ncbi:ATP-binding cassette domain-containing protein [Streptomyces sp. NPDC005900]|uniref:ABC transporter ATP-binding protein n=1 Tax=Streptomyces sp. NPDC005900 TaxID=3154569 RepID=UPI0033D6F0BD
MEQDGPSRMVRGERDLVRRLVGVGRRYGMRGPWVLRGVDLDVRAGALVRVRGANGTGKSTLLRLLAGIDAPGEGRIEGRPRTAFVPERFPAAMPFTAVGYLTHMARVHGLAGRAAERSAERWLERFGAGAYARTPLSELSKGSSQKVAVAQALLAAPDLLVLDEAWTGLDTSARAELDRAVAERTAAGGAVVFVDHDPRRLAGAAAETYEVVGTALERLTPQGTSGDGGPATAAGEEAALPWGGATVVVLTSGPPGAEHPAPVVATAGVTRPEAPEDATRLTVPESHSDLVLRELLTARPAWHVVSVERAGHPPDTGPPSGPPSTPALSPAPPQAPHAPAPHARAPHARAPHEGHSPR